jgi:hypothetical protein
MTNEPESQYHEPPSELGDDERDIHRAFVSLREEIEAVDWYHQRAILAADDDLREILVHNRDEEIEHAAMVLEWIRRQMPAVDRNLRRFLFREGPIVGGGADVEVASSRGLGIGAIGGTAS